MDVSIVFLLLVELSKLGLGPVPIFTMSVATNAKKIPIIIDKVIKIILRILFLFFLNSRRLDTDAPLTELECSSEKFRKPIPWEFLELKGL